MIVKLDKFKPIFILKGNQTLKPEEFLIGGNVIEIVSLVKLLAILIDDQINFNLNAQVRLERFYFVWSILSPKSLSKVENLQKKPFRFVHNFCSSSQKELLKKLAKLP